MAKKPYSKLLSFILAVSMLFSLIPTSAAVSSSADVQVKEWWLILGDDIGLNFRAQMETEAVATSTASINIDGTITNISFSLFPQGRRSGQSVQFGVSGRLSE